MTKKVTRVPPLSREAIETFSMNLLRKLQPEVFRDEIPVQIDAIYELYIPTEYKIETGYTDLTHLGSEILGYTDASRRRSFVEGSLVDTDDSVLLRRGRATIGHESGHCLQHVNVLNQFQSMLADEGLKLHRAERSTLKAYEDPEWQAWEFARACLMPRILVMKYYDKGYSLHDMAEIFDVNPSFMEVRLRKLGFF